MGNPGEEGKILQIVPLWFVYYQCVWIVQKDMVSQHSMNVEKCYWQC